MAIDPNLDRENLLADSSLDSIEWKLPPITMDEWWRKSFDLLWSRYKLTTDQIAEMPTGEVFLRLRAAQEGGAEEYRQQLRIAAYTNYHIVQVNITEQLPPFKQYLRDCGLSDEIKADKLEATKKRDTMVAEIDAAIDYRLKTFGGQRELTDEEKAAVKQRQEARDSVRSIQNQGDSRDRWGRGDQKPTSLPSRLCKDRE